MLVVTGGGRAGKVESVAWCVGKGVKGVSNRCATKGERKTGLGA